MVKTPPLARFFAHIEQTACPKGHPYDEANTAFDKNGHRSCRQCARNNARNAFRRKKGIPLDAPLRQDALT